MEGEINTGVRDTPAGDALCKLHEVRGGVADSGGVKRGGDDAGKGG